MKKHLLTSTALVAAGLMAVSAPAIAGGHAAKASTPSLVLKGDTRQVIGVGENDEAFDAANGERVGFDQQTDGEIHFVGSVTLDNGIKIRTNVQLEANSGGVDSGGDDIDEHWMRISGSFGELRMGSMDDAAMAMTTGYLGTWGTAAGILPAFDITDWVTNPGTVSTSTVARVDSTSDGENIAYFTPRMAGFQVGASFIPSTSEDNNDEREPNANGDTDGYSIGVNYVTRFEGASIAAAFGYGTNKESTAGVSDPEVYGMAISVSSGPFKVNVSYVDKDDQTNAAGVTQSSGQETFEIGAKYTMGANAFSIGYQTAEAKASTGSAFDGDEHTATVLSYSRQLGPGVSFILSGVYADFDDGLTNAPSSNSNQGTGLATGIAIRF
jgi:outer membrane protein OmpU